MPDPRAAIASGPPRKTLPEMVVAYERIVIIQALQLNDCSRIKTAQSLGISERCLYRRISALKIDMRAVTRGRSGRSKLEISEEDYVDPLLKELP